jgi:hypothetical protein
MQALVERYNERDENDILEVKSMKKWQATHQFNLGSSQRVFGR